MQCCDLDDKEATVGSVVAGGVGGDVVKGQVWYPVRLRWGQGAEQLWG